MNSSENKSAQNSSNWLFEFYYLMGFIALSVVTYGISAYINKSLYPYEWSGLSLFVAISLFILSIFGGVTYLEMQNKINLSKFLEENFDIDEYVKSNKTGLDSIVSHYGYVATFGLFLTLSIFSFKPFIKDWPKTSLSLLAILLMMAFFLYALFFLRLSRRFVSLKNKSLYIVIFISVLLVDAQAVKMIIKSVPDNINNTTKKKSDDNN